MRPSIFQLTYKELVSWMQLHQSHVFAANQLFKDLYKHALQVPRWHKIALPTRQLLEKAFSFDLPSPVHIHQDADKTVKFLFSLADEQSVEAVLIPFQQKYTLCLSSQVGCAMGCDFCHTATQGFVRNLHTSEIVGQYVRAKQWLKQHRPKEARILNVVFMGQGEPLHNFDEVCHACRIFLEARGPALADYKITVSTCGYMPGLIHWNEKMPNVNIALSLHAPDNLRRTQLIPVNKAYPLEAVLKEIDTIPLGPKRYVTFEYLLIEKFNDRDEDARAVGELLKHRKSILNIIPFNPYPGATYRRPSGEQINRFASLVSEFGFSVRIRTPKGCNILAACGQLRSKVLSE